MRGKGRRQGVQHTEVDAGASAGDCRTIRPTGTRVGGGVERTTGPPSHRTTTAWDPRSREPATEATGNQLPHKYTGAANPQRLVIHLPNRTQCRPCGARDATQI